MTPLRSRGRTMTAPSHTLRRRLEALEDRTLLTAPIQVLLLVGQSNMDGAPSISELRTPYAAPQTDVRIWQDDLGQNVGWTALRGGFGGDSNKGSGGNGSRFGPEVSLGRTLADARPESQFALIKHTQAGTAATMQDGWNPDRGGGLGPGQIWIDFIAKTNEALAALDASQLEYQVAGLFVFQGHRDHGSETGVEAANYEQNFTHFISGVRQEFGIPQLPVVFAQINDAGQGGVSHGGWVMVRNAQEAVDAADPYATMIQSDDLPRLDEVHFDAGGQINHGIRHANVFLGAPYEGSAKAGTDGFEAGNFTGGSEQWSAGAWTIAGDISVTTANAPHFGTRHALLRSSTGELTRSASVAGLTNVRLRFWSKLDSFESGDKAWVQVSADGVTWATLREFVDGEDDNAYRFHEIDVPALGDTVFVRFRAQMNQSTDYWYVDDVRLTGTTRGMPPAELPNKFYVVDDTAADRTFEYGDAGGWVDDYTLAAGNAAPRGAASTAAGTRVWVVDQNRNVYVYDSNGGLQGLWSAGSLSTQAVVGGIATNGTDIWIVDGSADKVYRYADAASRLSGVQNAASSFSLNNGNKNPKDLVTDGTSIWVVDDAGTDKVFKYTLAGALLGSWTLAGGGGSPTGITLDPSNGQSHLWVVDSAADRVFQYDNARSRTSGSQAASTTFALAAGNNNPQGIADPPTVSIGDATAAEGGDLARFIDIPISSASSPVDRPKSIVKGPDGDYFVTSSLTNSVLRYDGATFQYLGEFVSPGSGGLLNPIDLEFGNGDLFVSSRNSNEVLRYDGQTGSFIGAFVPAGANGILGPTDLVVRDGKLYVGAMGSHDVHRYDLATGTFIDRFVTTGSTGIPTPAGLAFGPDGNLYVADYVPGDPCAVLRYNGSTGAYLGEFVPAGVGGLYAPLGIAFGPDGNLYVADGDSRRVLRYDGFTGAFLGVFVPNGLPLGNQPLRLLFSQNQLLVTNQEADQVVRYDVPPWAVFNVTLTSTSAMPVTVDYSAVSGTAVAGTDFVATSGTLTFIPGETSKTILVRVLDDGLEEPSETFTVTLSNPAGATIADGQAVGTILANDAPPQVAAVAANGPGVAQRSRVASVTVTFNDIVTFTGPPADAFTLTRIDGGSVGSFTATASVVDGVTRVTLSSFFGAEAEFGSLADGRYRLTVRADQVRVGGQSLDGNGDGLGGDDYTLDGSAANGLYRLYGDGNGDGTVNAADFALFRGAFGSSSGQAAYVEWLDLDRDGFINAFDFAQFRNRFGSSVP